MTHMSTAGQLLRQYHRSQKSTKSSMLKNVIDNKLPISKESTVRSNSSLPKSSKQNTMKITSGRQGDDSTAQAIRN